MKQRHSLSTLVPYLLRYRYRFAVGGLMVLLTVAAGMFSPWVLKYVVDDLHSAVLKERLPIYAAMILGISAVEGFFRFWMRRILIGLSRTIEYDLRNDFLAHLQKLSLSFYRSNNTGDMMSRATNDLNAVRSVLGPGIMYSCTTLITVLVGTIILFRLSWQLTLIAYVPLLSVSITVKKLGGQIHDRFEAIQEQFSSISTKAQENLSGIRVVKAFAREESEIEDFRKLNREYVQRSIGLIRLWGTYYPLMTALIGLSSVVLLWFGGRQVIIGRLSLGEFVAFMGYLSMLTWPTIAAGWVINIFQRGTASMARILEIMNATPEIQDIPGAERPSVVAGSISIRNLTFTYPDSACPTLRNVSLEIPAGKSIALVGPTGSGKTTLLNLIPRLLDPPAGAVSVDGKDVREWPSADLRGMIGYVPQETFLFSDTIRSNIGFGMAGDILDEVLQAAARASQISDEVGRFPQQYLTFVGERGITLSGGQKQRVAISRALAKSPRILIFDDSLSNVDTYTEERILAELSEIMRGRTTLLVSHRISTVKNSDHIAVLAEGRIVESGTHDSLLRLQGVYADLYQKQLLEEELETA